MEKHFFKKTECALHAVEKKRCVNVHYHLPNRQN